MSIQPDPSTVPDVLRDRTQWIAWRSEERDGRMTKVPVDPNTGDMAATDDPETWSGFETALRHAERHDCGVGFVFTESDQFAGVDLDKCRDPETKTIEPWAQRIIQRFDSYTEVSPSGTGYHVYVLAIHPGEGHRKGMPRECDELAHYDDPEIEMYDRLRFFTFTGDRVEMVSGNVEQRHDEYREVHDEWINTDDEPTEPVEVDESITNGVEGTGNGEIRNELEIPLSVIRRKDEKLDRLLTDLEPAGYAYPSPSEADLATCVKLRWWRFTAKNMARVMRRHRPRGKTLERDDYLSRTIEKACLRVGGDIYCESVTLEPEERDMIADYDYDTPRDYVPSCNHCEFVLGDHTRMEFDPLFRECPQCHEVLTAEEVFTR